MLAPNHFSQMDHFFTGLYLRRKIRFMAKSQMFGPPVLTYIYSHGGVFPVRRGHHDEEAFDTAFELLARRKCCWSTPRAAAPAAAGWASRKGASAGSRSNRGAGGPGRDPRLGGGPALEELRFPKVTIRFGEPIAFPREGSEP